MAVTRVFGRVDGVDVVLERQEGERWQVPVPLDRDGEYVVEVIAEDDAGNQAYLTKMLFVVNTALLSVQIVPLPYYEELIMPVYQTSMLPVSYYTELIEPVYAQKGGTRCSV